MEDNNTGADAFAGDQSGVTVVSPDAQALADAQAKLAADQAAHDQAATQLATDQAALDAAVAKLSEDQAALSQAQAAHDAAVAAATVAVAQAALDAAAQAATQGAQAPVSTGDVAPTTQLEAAHSMVDDIEAIAIKWGGDIGTDLRNLAGKLRSLFGEKPAADSAAQ